jgi:CheY-like chemotaxis protein
MPDALMVGINFSLAVTLKPLLRLHGFRVTSASSGSEALARIQAVIPNIVITEDILPDMTSKQLEQTIRRDLFLQNPRMMDVKLIILVNPAPNTQGMSGYGFGPRLCLVKPVDPGKLVYYSGQLVTMCPSFAPVASDEEQAVAQQYFILTVDADVATRRYIRIILERQGYRVETALDVAEGLQHIQRNRPNLVIAPGHFHERKNEMFYRVNRDPELQDIPFILLEEEPNGGGLRSDFGADAVLSRWPEPDSLRSAVKRLVASPTRRQMWLKSRANRSANTGTG